MSRFPRLARTVAVAVTALSLSALSIAVAPSAGAAASGSMVDSGNGSLIVTYSVSGGDDVFLFLIAQGSTCSPSSPFGQAYLFSVPAVLVNNDPWLGTSPATVTAGNRAMNSQGPNAVIAAGFYQACLYTLNSGTFALAQSLATTMGSPTPTTTSTTTTLAPGGSTGADPAADPVAPAFTG